MSKLFRSAPGGLRGLTALSGVLVGSLLLGACGGGSTGAGGSDEGSGDIVIGSYGPLSGPAASISVLYDGMQAYFDEVNAKGGIKGHKVRLKVQDDQLNPAQTPSAARQLVERDKALMMCGPSGSPTTMAVKDYLEARNVAIVPGAGSSELTGRTSYLQVPTYTPLAAQLAQYAVEDMDMKRVAIAYSEDSVGKPTVAGARWQLEQMGRKPVAEVTYNATAPDQSALAAKLKAAKADFVIINNTAPVISQVFKAADKIGFRPQWGTVWPALNKNLLELSGGALDKGNIVFSSPFILGDAPEAGEYRAVLDRHKPGLDVTDTIVMLGWTSATVCHQVLERAIEAAGGKTPTREQVVAAMPGLTYDDAYVNGLRWTEDNRTGQREANVIGVKNGKFVALTDFRELPDAPENQR
ncbi:ABC transporter substrate-binding protein [Streptomyces sp. NPDC085927]|uniref:ABC transporter substrate-binding protein n=1 Tax=Streptomyces sp. NPDC085927 TaxID=3365738 RepID=UPI0037D1BF7B